MYRNIWYSSRDRSVILWTWDEEGNRITETIPVRPYLFIESQGHDDGTSIYNTKLKKVSFDTEYERKQYVKKSGIHRIFYNLPITQQVLIDRFKGQNESQEFSQYPLKVYTIDIETYSPGNFPLPTLAKDPINLITIHDSLEDKSYTWGTGEYIPKNDKSYYFKCDSEEKLLKGFLKFWSDNYPDIVTGWNIEGFDIPYLINRITNILSEDHAKRLSPVKRLWCQENVVAKFGRQEDKWWIYGLTIVDYMEAYKVFSMSEKSSYSLNYVAEDELGKGKLAFNAANLSDLADQNWEQFVDYNIEDVRLVVELDKKLQFLSFVRMLAYLGLTKLDAALGTIKVVTGAIALKALERDLIIPTFQTAGDKYEGGFVMDPNKGIKDAVVSFDANSLYPNTIITLNLSPETKLGKIVNTNVEKDEYTIHLINGHRYTLNKIQFYSFLQKHQVSVSKANILFSQSKKGICPELIDNLYSERVEIQNKLDRCEKALKKLHKNANKYKEIESAKHHFEILQYTLKILLNRVYGYFANSHSPMCDIDLAESITLTGQATVKEAGIIVNKWAQDKYSIDTTEQLLIYSDTDSCYLTIKPILDKLKVPLAKDKKITKETYDIAEEIQTILNERIVEWAQKSLNSKDCRFKFKRETICETGIFIRKKRYILHILDKKGIETDEIKYVGVDVVSSSTPKAVKPLLKHVAESMIYTKSQKETNKILKEAYYEFRKLSADDLSTIKNIREYNKYASKSNGFKTPTGCPFHVKGAVYYNHLLKLCKVDTKYEPIRSGQKIKCLYVEPNKYDIKCISFIDKLPEEFELKPNYDIMFEKIVISATKRLFEVVDWKVKKPTTERSVDLLELLG